MNTSKTTQSSINSFCGNSRGNSLDLTPALLLAEARRTKTDFNVGLLRQLWQATYLRYSQCRLDPWEYYFFQVYLDRYPMAEKKCFVGWRGEMAMDRAANTDDARKLANDKLSFHKFMADRSAPLPRLSAVYSGDERCVSTDLPGVVQLGDSDDVERYLKAPANYPLFVKPLRGTRGRNVFAIRHITADRCELELLSGQLLSLPDFARNLDPHARGGVLFQELLRSHAEIASLCGNRLTSIRMIIVMTPGGPEILSAVWRIPTGENVTDNFDVGNTGNLVAGVDLDSGRIQRIVQGAGWKTIPMTHHPDTGGQLHDVCLPDWRMVKSMCLDYAGHFPGLHLQHWDIALTDRGPVIIELNVEGGMRTHQIVQQRGILEQRLKAVGVRPQ